MGTMMTTRFARPALMAAVTLALLLAGCRVTVLQVDYAPTEPNCENER